ncbi:GntR family transcriptional regulator [Isoptericola haloaureus]|uniref:GntR family transcriptional regulator n=1 Tax=Isoptericola haloaureus TaxID=1542902 RepID=A0ABU7Z5E0_9MICO
MFDGPEPLYVQIAQMIRSQVLAGELAEDEQVMSTTQFATTFRINPATAAKAFTGLVDEGVLYKRRGLGMFVAPGARQRLLEHDRTAYFDDVLAPALAQAAVLGISDDEIVDHIRSRSTTTEES